MSRNPIYIKLINSARWKRLRAEKLTANPICEECEANGKSTPATEVHHIVFVESVPTAVAMERLMFSYSNLKSLCHSCHAEIHRLAFSQSKESIQANNRRATERFTDKFL
ncbi:HNH endonuclease [Phocaeicola sp.]